MIGYLRTKWGGGWGSHGYDYYKCNTTTPTSTITVTKHIGITIYNKINTTHTKRVGGEKAEKGTRRRRSGKL